MTRGKPVIATWWPVVPCVLSVVLFFLWVFDVGHGPFSGERFGTAGEWGSAVGTTGAVAVSLHLLITDRRKARAEARKAEIARLVEKVHGHKPIAGLSLNEIPVVWVMTELGPGRHRFVEDAVRAFLRAAERLVDSTVESACTG